MKQEDLSKIKFRLTGHLTTENDYTIKTESEDGRIAIIDRAYIPKSGNMSSSFRQYIFDGKIYKSLSSFLRAIKQSKTPFIDYEDCVHIGACRRLSKIVESKIGKSVARGCGVSCNMFKSRTDLIEQLHDSYLKEDSKSKSYKYGPIIFGGQDPEELKESKQ